MGGRQGDDREEFGWVVSQHTRRAEIERVERFSDLVIWRFSNATYLHCASVRFGLPLQAICAETIYSCQMYSTYTVFVW